MSHPIYRNGCTVHCTTGGTRRAILHIGVTVQHCTNPKAQQQHSLGAVGVVVDVVRVLPHALAVVVARHLGERRASPRQGQGRGSGAGARTGQ